MGLGAKLNFAFFTVIIVMVATHAGFQIWSDQNTAHVVTHNALEQTTRQLNQEIDVIQKFNEGMAAKLSSDGSFDAAYGARDKGAVASISRNFCERNGLPGFVLVFDSSGKVYYSGDTPARSGYEPRDIDSEVHSLLRAGRVWYGAAAPTQSGILSLIGMVPIKSGDSTTGLVAICQPVNSEFLIGLQKKLDLSFGLKDMDLLLYSVRDGHVCALTPGLESNDGGFVASLTREGPKVIKEPEIVVGGRIWKAHRFETADQHVTDYILTSTKLPDVKKQMTQIAGQAALSAAIAIILAIAMSILISGKINNSIRLLIQRAKELSTHRSSNPPALEGLSGDFIELAETIDAAITGSRSSVKSLQGQMGKHQEEITGKQQIIDDANSKLDAVNKQLTVQSRQLSEVSKQINFANSQSVLLQHRLATVMQVSTEGFLILDAFGNVLAVNPTFLRWSGNTEHELAGRYCFDLMRRPGEPRPAPGGHTPFSLHGGNPGDLIMQFYPEGIVYHQQQDTVVEVLAHLQPVTTDDQNIQGYILVLRDKSLHSEASRLRNEIVAMLQESIRVPLLMTERKWSSVLSTSNQSGNPNLGNALNDLHGTYQQLLGVVDSLLMMHTGIVPPSPPPVREQISITRLIGDCLEQLAKDARARQIVLDYKTVTGLPSTALDKQLVRDVVLQLIEQMILITSAGGRVRVESVSKGAEIRVSIFSSGPALPQTEIEDMFVGFIQGKHPEESYGTRLSMYLARNNVERMGGRIWAESDRGTYIYVILPINES